MSVHCLAWGSFNSSVGWLAKAIPLRIKRYEMHQQAMSGTLRALFHSICWHYNYHFDVNWASLGYCVVRHVLLICNIWNTLSEAGTSWEALFTLPRGAETHILLYMFHAQVYRTSGISRAVKIRFGLREGTKLEHTKMVGTKQVQGVEMEGMRREGTTEAGIVHIKSPGAVAQYLGLAYLFSCTTHNINAWEL